MDFTQKIIDKQREVQELYQNEAARKTLEKETDDEEIEPEMEIPPPEDPDEEWLVLLSGLLRLGNCMRKEFHFTECAVAVIGFLLLWFWLILHIEKRWFFLFPVLRDNTLCSHKGNTTIESTSGILRNTSEGNVLQVRCVAVASLLHSSWKLQNWSD